MAKTATRTPTKRSELASQIRHRDGCPADRIEEYDARRPESANGDEITVARCVDCGASSVE